MPYLQSMMLRVLAAACVALATVGWVQTSYAQDEPEPEYVTPSEREQELNEKGVGAIIQGNYVRAIALLEESLELGESNVLYLNLGRAYQKLGHCKQARAAFEKVQDAPPLRQPAPELVANKAQKYLDELDANCVEEPSQDDASQPTAQDSTSPESGGGNVAGWAAVGSGVALGGAGLALHLVARSKRSSVGGLDDEPATVNYPEAKDIESQANTLDSVGLGLGIAGVAAAGLGTFLLVTNSSSEAKAARISVEPRLDGASLVFRAAF